MGNQLKKFHSKRHHGNDDEPEKNDEKADGSVEYAEEIEPKSLANICFELVERIFDFLDLESLLMVAQTSKRLQMVAAAKFGIKYGKKRIVVSADSIPDYEKHGIHTYKNGAIHIIIGLEYGLPFLRCFGAKILFLSVQNTDRVTHNEYMHQYINKYCADTLNYILFVGEGESSNELFPRPFKNVHLVCTHQSGIMKQLSNFVNLFPNLCRLQIGGCSIRDNISTAVSLPRLEHLGIDFTCDLAAKSVSDLLHANKQLQSIQFSFGTYSKLSMAKLLEMISENKLIVKLKVTKRKNAVIHVNASELLRLASDHPVLIELDLQPCRLDVNDAVAFIGVISILNPLELFKFRVKGRSEYARLLTKLDNKWKHEVKLDKNNVGHHIITLSH